MMGRRWTDADYAAYLHRQEHPTQRFRLTERPEYRAVHRSQIPFTDDLFRDLVYPAMDELHEWMPLVQLYAARQGWRSFHVYDSRKSEPGFPDLVIVREAVLFVELKDNKQPLRSAQRDWRDALRAAGAHWYCWRPRDVEEVIEVLNEYVDTHNRVGHRHTRHRPPVL